MAEMAGQIESGDLIAAPGYVTLEALYNYAETASVALAYAKGGSGANALDYAAATQAADAAFQSKKGNVSVMPVSASAVLRMNRYGRLADAAKARGSYGESYAYNLLAREFAGAATGMIASEPARFIGVMANVTPSVSTGEAGYATPLTLSLVNDTDAPQQVKARLKVPADWASAQTETSEVELTIPAHDAVDRTYNVNVPQSAIKGRYEVAFEIEHGGALFDTKKVELTVEDGLDVRLLPVAKTIKDLDIVSVQLTGTSTAVKSGTVTLKGPDGGLLEPVTTNAFSNLKKGDRLQLDFRWTYRQTAPFNEYKVDLEVDEASDGRSIFHDAQLPLDFDLIQSAGEAAVAVDGNLADWQDAYPVHLRRKDQNATGYQDSANLEATAYAKWAADGLYVAVDVRDDVHKQSENTANMWKNDSVQISLDPLNNRESPYGADDVEWSFALADDGTHLVNVFNSTAPNPNGDMSGKVPFEAVRDEAAKRTRYEFKIPSAYVKDLRPALGGKLGFNVAVNDADYQNGRDNFIQWTQGTADSKNTSLYDAFAFVDVPLPPGGGDNGGDDGGDNGGDDDDGDDGGSPPDQPTTGIVASSPAAPSGILTVSAASLQNAANGVSSVEAPAGTTELRLPADAAAWLGANKLEVKAGKLVLEIPSGVLKQLAERVPAADRQGSALSLGFLPLKSDAWQALLAGAQTPGTTVRAGGEAFELTLSIRTAAGSAVRLTKFEESVTIRFRIDPALDPKLSAIFYMAEDGRPEWVGGERDDGFLTAEVRHFSAYAMLEVKREFSDLPAAHWAYGAVRALAARGIVQGSDTGAFEPGREVTRAEFTAMLAKALRLPKPADTAVQAETIFADVPANGWYAEAVSAAYGAGIATGKSATAFDPDGRLTREEMAVLTMKAYRLLHGERPVQAASAYASLFADEAAISAWALSYVRETVALGLTQGRGADRFVPKGTATRAEAARIVDSLLFPNPNAK
ncbi:S-layer homology domain-containing protein [Cohnella rhizosphaerae]|uniref:S-layer homology domain-containing protein n=1 Tax=Cohnella rhizosphaerae TaxID=1457232 RepID=A0A9X4QT53_9BACL|nr:S-layer homology domain-containing protein [Cohnella rhizosphaerae]MDG0809999.1 S-layer homology domain-containing protein [Cohnella rhizosphaerae]